MEILKKLDIHSFIYLKINIISSTIGPEPLYTSSVILKELSEDPGIFETLKRIHKVKITFIII